MTRNLTSALIVTSFLAACDSGDLAPVVEEPSGRCWGAHVTPAVVETVTEQIEVRPAVYETETRQVIVRERIETRFETPCKNVQTTEFIATLQRALSARGHYNGAITGQMSPRTRIAIRRYQSSQGLDSSVLSMKSARKLGLVAVPRPEPDTPEA